MKAYYPSRLHERHIMRIVGILPELSATSLDLAAEINRALGLEVSRRQRNDDPHEVPAEPEPLQLDSQDWTDDQAADALRAAYGLCDWAKGKHIRQFANAVLYAVVGVVSGRLMARSADARQAQMELAIREANQDCQFVPIHDDAELAGMLQPIA